MEKDKKRYYYAYDDRYIQVHSRNLQWFSNCPTKILTDTIQKYSISTSADILEIGCGEGRDAIPLLKKGYRVLATDVSGEAIEYCKKLASDYHSHFFTLDCLSEELSASFPFIYAISVVHMLLTDSDRDQFFRFIYNHLSENGIALICTMGDGVSESRSDASAAFDLKERTHQETGTMLNVAGTSFRMVNFDTFMAEILRSNLKILEQGITEIEPDYASVMYAVVARNRNAFHTQPTPEAN